MTSRYAGLDGVPPTRSPQHQGRGEHHQVVVVGAGQAGLSASWLLTRRGIDHVLLERHTVGHDWQDRRWRNFTLVTPNWQCSLPGYPYPGAEPDGFMTRTEVLAYLHDYAASFDAPVREGAAVVSLRRHDQGGFVLELSVDGEPSTMTADQVVVAVGGYHLPKIPAVAGRLDPAISQLHSADYQGPEQLADGAVLVVGSGQSGAQIAEDLHLAGRAVHLVTGSAPRCARRYRGRDCVDWLAEMGTYDVPVEAQPGGLAAREKTNHYLTGRDGGRDIDLRAFALEGMQLYGRLVDADGTAITTAPNLTAHLDAADQVADSIKDAIDGHIARSGVGAPTEDRYVPVWVPPVEPTGLDLAAAGVTSVVWATGFSSDYRWMQVPIFDGAGRPYHQRGVTPVPGLCLLGLPWLHTWGSGRFAGIARDAEFVVEHLSRLQSDRLVA